MTKFLDTGECQINIGAIDYVEPGEDQASAYVVVRGQRLLIPLPHRDIIDALHGAFLLPWFVVTVDSASKKGRES